MVAVPPAANAEQLQAQYQGGTWEHVNRRAGGFVAGGLQGYQFGAQTLRAYYHQVVPDLSYIDPPTWSGLSREDRDKAHLPCAPAVVVLLVSRVETVEDLQAKAAKCVECGTREAAVVVTRSDRVWIHNRQELPYFAKLTPIEFDSWPGFTLDCEAILDARICHGLP